MATSHAYKVSPSRQVRFRYIQNVSCTRRARARIQTRRDQAEGRSIGPRLTEPVSSTANRGSDRPMFLGESPAASKLMLLQASFASVAQGRYLRGGVCQLEGGYDVRRRVDEATAGRADCRPSFKMIAEVGVRRL